MQGAFCQNISFPQNHLYTAGMGRRLTRARPKQGERLASLRVKAGLSQAELAKLIGVQQQTVAFWELSDKPPRSDVLINLAKVLGVRLEDLLTGETLRLQPSGPAGKVRKLFEHVSRLPKRQQEKVVEFVSAFVEKYDEARG